MAQAMDAHSSFVYLVDNLPKWRARIESLSTHAVEQNAKFVAEYARLLQQVRPRRKKTPSMSSIHTAEGNDPTNDNTNAEEGTDHLSSPDPRHINPLEAGNKYLYAQARRKRKPGPSIRSGASGPQKFRNRNHVVVYYDGYLQKQLDDMVKEVGLGRNNLRKGKNALAAATGFRLPTLPFNAGPGVSMLDEVRPILMCGSRSPMLPAKRSVLPATIPNSDEANFVRADKELEHVQSLCETAAHQFLRDGDCKTELDRIQQKLDALLVQATTAAESLKKLQDSQEALPGDSPSLNSNLDSGSDGTLLTLPSLGLSSPPRIGPNKDVDSFRIINSLDRPGPQGFFNAPVVPILGSPNELMADTIEVDDTSDQESIVVDLTQYRLTNPRRLRA